MSSNRRTRTDQRGAKTSKRPGAVDPHFLDSAAAPTTHFESASAAHKTRALSKVVAGEVLPRLHHAFSNAPRQSTDLGTPAERLAPPSDLVCDLAYASINGNRTRIDDLIAEERRAGVSVDGLILNAMSDAARYLGQLWVDDKISFFATTFGTAILQQVVQDLSSETESTDGLPHEPLRILLTTVPGEQHVMSLAVLEHFFKQAGWDVYYEPRPSTEGLVNLVQTIPFSVIGLTLSDHQLLKPATHLITRLTKNSCSSATAVLVGGHVFKSHPDAVTAVGAAGYAEDASTAVSLANALSSSPGSSSALTPLAPWYPSASRPSE